DRSTQGHPGKYTYCIAELEEDSPWPPLHVDRGLPREASAVTVFAAEGPHNVLSHYGETADAIVVAIADTMACLGSFSPGESFVGAGGGAGGHSAFIPSWSRERNSLAVTREIP